MAIEQVGRDIYMRHTACDGKSVAIQHRVWDAEKFVAAQQREAEKLNAQQKDGEPRKARADQITEDQYRKERT